MSLSQISLLFALELSFGALVTFLLSDRRALGPRYFMLGGWIVLGFYGLAGSLVWEPALDAAAAGADRALGWLVAAAAASLLGFASVCGWDRPRLEAGLLWGAALAGGGALALAALRAGPGPPLTPTEQGLAVAAAAGSALVLGFTTFSMILGHWYLVARDLSLVHLARLVRPLVWLLAARAALSGLVLWVMYERVLGPGNASLADVMARQPERVLDVFNVWARIPLGLLLPAVLAVMAGVTVRMKKTQPATGILYAMTVTVLLGELMGSMVAGSTGVPL